ncbi:MAG TPA: 5-formyltetrahydrofolate cyclo-ligase [Steroidobacteraceae bacterium]|nr:5-formyltetrahydrofolate cyclo-ligase [Steroidobacteraceae bacterium]
MAPSSADRPALRRQLRQLRGALTRAERAAAERRILHHLQRLRLFAPGARLATYLAMPDEVNLAAAVRLAQASGARLFVPLVTSRRRRTMAFVPFRPDGALRTGAFGIAEPVVARAQRLAAVNLDTVLVPLLGFDRTGQRLGMGAGFYDRALARRRDPHRPWRRPRLIGVAYACQELEAIAPAAWDVALDLVVTDREVVRCRR